MPILVDPECVCDSGEGIYLFVDLLVAGKAIFGLSLIASLLVIAVETIHFVILDCELAKQKI